MSYAEFDAEVNEKIGLQPVYTISPVINAHHFQGREKFECKVRIDTLEFTGGESSNTIDEKINEPADNLALRKARHYLSQRNWKLDSLSKKDRKLNSEKETIIKENIYNIPHLNRNSLGWAILINEMGNDSLNVIYHCANYMSSEMLAMHFKDLANYVTHGCHKFTTQTYQNGHFTGYFSILRLDCGTDFEGLAPMLNENQAEQSAAEAFLRERGFIPRVKREDYLIQPYQGGQSICIPGMNIVDKPYIFTSTLLTDILEAFLESRSISTRYFIQETNLTKVCNVYGGLEPKVNCILSISGKFFKSHSAEITRIATQFAAEEALKYFGISDFQERMELRKHIHINKYSFAEYPQTIYNSRPSVCRGWLSARYCRPEINGDADTIESLCNSGLVMRSIPVNPKIVTEFVEREMKRNPSFQGLDLIDMEDLCVADVDTNNPSVFTVGNSKFSLKMFCEEGKLYSENRGFSVKVLPGHIIQKLKCEYRLYVPSLEVHINAIECFELYSRDPPLPVVTSCGVVVLSHDPEESPEDVFVLVRRGTFGTFDSNIYCLAAILTSLVESNSCDITPAEFTKGIKKWRCKDVKLLSNMTMDSMCDLMSLFPKYDNRWNELFAEELPAVLKEIQDTCLHELKRREEENVPIEDEVEAWELPNSEFVNHFEAIGIHLEDTIFCVKRVLNESGVKVDLSCIDSFLSIDMPRKTDNNHGVRTGAVSRFYVWGSRNDRFSKQKRMSQALKGHKVELTGPPLENGVRKYLYNRFALGDLSTRLQNLQNIELVNSDGSKRKYIGTAKCRINRKKTAVKVKGRNKNKNKDHPSRMSDVVACSEGQMEIVADIVENGTPSSSCVSSNIQPSGNQATKDIGLGKSRVDNGSSKKSDIHGDGIEDYDDLSNVNDRPIISLPGDPNYVDHQSSLEEYCRLKKWKRPKFSTRFQRRKNRKQTRQNHLTFGPYLLKVYYRGKESVPYTAKKGLELLGYLPQTGHKLIPTKVPVPGDEDFQSYEHSWKIFRLSKGFACPKYTWKFDPVHITFRGIMYFGNARIVAGETSKTRHEGLCRVSYTALQQFGFLIGVPFEAGYNEWDGDKFKFKETDGDKESDGGEFNEEMESNDAEDLGSNKAKWVSKVKVESTEMSGEEKSSSSEMCIEEKSEMQVNRKRKAEDMAKSVMDNGGSGTLTKVTKGETANDSTKSNKKKFKGIGRKWGKFPHPLPARDAFQDQCAWKKLDEAIDVCPMLKIISQTSQFKDKLKKYVDVTNEASEGKYCVKSYHL